MYRILGADQKEYGPVTADLVRQWITEGRVSANTAVRLEQSNDWKPLSTFAEFAGFVSASAPPVLPPPRTDSGVSNAVSTIVPYKNVKALLAYYLGVFSVIPVVGIVLGIAAFILGLLGLKFARAHPESKGKVHAWIGIVVGGLFGFGYLALTLLAIGAAVSKK